MNRRVVLLLENELIFKKTWKYTLPPSKIPKFQKILFSQNLLTATDFWNWWFSILAFHFLWWAFFLSVSAFDSTFWLVWITIENVFGTNTKVFVQIIDTAPSRWASAATTVGLDFAAGDSWSRATSICKQFNWVFLK